ncbi:MAG TPA: hypothetical protein VK501_04245 [Baekduia sp.]|uniref:hypothetical protein n=1 Tax=Baekduia sp. TaxID=2600305 RepID=UPI002C353912|nr:hypothetical protein [Baekduia sp.]HMJ33108.1 hypothetical protein [Baekduia sp.]
MARGKKGAEGAPEPGGIRLSSHPRARRQIRMAKGWSGLLCFGLVLYLSRGAGLPFADALLRGVFGGIAGYLAAWMIAVTVWRHLALAELEDLRLRLLAKMEAQAAAAEAAAAEAAARSGDATKPPTMVSQR